MAGPPFDIRGPIDFKLSAQNVQCIHTNSGDKGTRHFNCHQNWRLGNCGLTQGNFDENFAWMNFVSLKID